jgi:hypothetical protein
VTGRTAEGAGGGEIVWVSSNGSFRVVLEELAADCGVALVGGASGSPTSRNVRGGASGSFNNGCLRNLALAGEGISD